MGGKAIITGSVPRAAQYSDCQAVALLTGALWLATFDMGWVRELSRHPSWFLLRNLPMARADCTLFLEEKQLPWVINTCSNRIHGTGDRTSGQTFLSNETLP